MVELNRRRLATLLAAAFDHVRINRPLREELRPVDLLRFLLVQLALSAVAVCERRFVILIRKYCVKRGTVASRNSVVGFGVFDIFNTVFAENDAPMRFGIIGIFLEYLVVDFFRFIKLAF